MPKRRSARQEERDRLLEAERAFDQATTQLGAEGWASFFAENGMMFPAGRDIVTGRSCIQELMEAAFTDPKYSLHWEPEGVEVARSGELGFTYGHYVFTGTGAEGRVTGGTGKYVSVWKKQPGGAWKVIADIGTPNRLPAA